MSLLSDIITGTLDNNQYNFFERRNTTVLLFDFSRINVFPLSLNGKYYFNLRSFNSFVVCVGNIVGVKL